MQATTMPTGLVWAFLGFLLVALLRGQATYWLARGAASGVARRGRDDPRWRGWAQSPTARRGREQLTRFGWPAVTLCYLAVGVQTVVLASAGAMRMPWGRFTAAQVPGAALWAGIYSTIGWTAWVLLVRHAVASAWLWLALAGVLAVLAGTAWWRRRGIDASGAQPPSA